MRVTVFQHADYEAPGAILDWIADRGHARTTVDWSAPGAVAPDPAEADLLVIMGGPMNVDETDRLPWLLPERRAIRAHVEAGLPTLGICLGAQLLARVHDAEVTANDEPEIGWFPVRLSADALGHPLFAGWPEELLTFHWHGDTFALPVGAMPIGASAACTRQGFLLGDRVVGLQFHPEATRALIEGFVDRGGHTLPTGRRFVQTPADLIEGSRHAGPAHRHLFALLDRLAAVARRRRPDA